MIFHGLRIFITVVEAYMSFSSLHKVYIHITYALILELHTSIKGYTNDTILFSNRILEENGPSFFPM